MSLCGEVDLMLHLGHAELGEAPDKVIFLEARMKEDLGTWWKRRPESSRRREWGSPLLFSMSTSSMGRWQALKEHGIEGLSGPAAGGLSIPDRSWAAATASARALNVEEYLFIGTGKFHPLGIALATGKRVVAADPVTGEVSEIDTDPMLRRRFGAIARAADAKSFAVLVSKKPGQKRMELAERIKALGEAGGREMFLVYLDNIEPDRLLNLGAEAAVSTACPRVALDDAAKYKIPILTPPEFEVLLGEREWEEYVFDEIE